MEWPECDLDGQRDSFYAELLQRLGAAPFVAVVPNPVPLDGVREGIERTCGDGLRAVGLPRRGVAWVCSTERLGDALPGLFHARRPELAFLSFEETPAAKDIVSALESADGRPARRVLMFDEGALVETRPDSGESSS